MRKPKPTNHKATQLARHHSNSALCSKASYSEPLCGMGSGSSAGKLRLRVAGGLARLLSWFVIKSKCELRLPVSSCLFNRASQGQAQRLLLRTREVSTWHTAEGLRRGVQMGVVQRQSVVWTCLNTHLKWGSINGAEFSLWIVADRFTELAAEASGLVSRSTCTSEKSD